MKEVLIISGPSGSGKNFLMEFLLKNYPNFFCRVVPFTTRQKRIEEIEGVDYEFFSYEEHEKMKEHLFLSRYFMGNWYGFRKKIIQEAWGQNKIPIMLIYAPTIGEVLGALEVFDVNAKRIFLSPSMEILKKRLLERDGSLERVEEVERELKLYQEMDLGKVYKEFVVSNDDISPIVREIEKMFNIS